MPLTILLPVLLGFFHSEYNVVLAFLTVGSLGGTAGILGTQQTNAPFQFEMGANSNASPANTFMFSAGKQSQSLGSSGQQQQPVQPAFNFGQQAARASAGSGSASQGYNFSLNAGPNLNFGGSQTAAPPAFSANTANTASASELSRRVIKKATRRKK